MIITKKYSDDLAMQFPTKFNLRPMVFTENIRKLGSKAIGGKFYVSADKITLNTPWKDLYARCQVKISGAYFSHLLHN